MTGKLENASVGVAQAACRIHWLILALTLLVLGGCGGAGDDSWPDDSDGQSSVGAGWVAIQSPTEATAYSTERESVDLAGAAFVSPDKSRCCEWPPETGVTVTWSSSTGASGSTYQYAGFCSFFGQSTWVCEHHWSTNVPLAIGANVVRVVATDGRNSGADVITITRQPDRTAPAVSSVSPLNGSSNVPVNASLTATFSEAMDNASISSATFTLRDDSGNPVQGTVSVNDRTMTFVPGTSLRGFAGHTATLSTDVKDAAGNGLAGAYTWHFTTGNADITPPAVVSVAPASGSACTAPDGELRVVFSEPVDPSSVTNHGIQPSFTLADVTGGSAGTISGEVRVQSDGMAAVFDPAFALGESHSFSATLTTRIKDRAGNYLPMKTAWQFSTASGDGAGAWRASSTSGAPKAATGHSVVWTGSEMIVFGPDGGARYAPATDSWTALPAGAPPMQDHVAVWTGSEMLVWSAPGAGARYNPATNAWSPISAAGAPAARTHATAVWTGTEMIVWGGRAGDALAADAGAYNPTNDAWRPLSQSGSPGPRVHHTAVWTGSRMIVWGGDNACIGSCSGAYVTPGGGIYDPMTDRWEPIATSGEPSPRTGHSAVWTGSEMAVWGGNEWGYDEYYARGLNDGSLYDPATDTWRALSASCGPSGRYGHVALWTGAEMIVWGGLSGDANTVWRKVSRSSGGRYDAAAGGWQHTTGANPPSGIARGVWTGSLMLLWPGYTMADGSTAVAIYTP